MLVEVVERNEVVGRKIHVAIYNSFKEAYQAMEKAYGEVIDKGNGGYINPSWAYVDECEPNHYNYEWDIIEC